MRGNQRRHNVQLFRFNRGKADDSKPAVCIQIGIGSISGLMVPLPQKLAYYSGLVRNKSKPRTRRVQSQSRSIATVSISPAKNALNGVKTCKYNNNQMPHRRNTIKKNISLQTRKTLVALVLDSGYTYLRAAKRLRLKLSTAKLIVKRFKDHGDLYDPTTKAYHPPPPSQGHPKPQNLRQEELPYNPEFSSDDQPILSRSHLNEPEQGCTAQVPSFPLRIYWPVVENQFLVFYLGSIYN